MKGISGGNRHNSTEDIYGTQLNKQAQEKLRAEVSNSFAIQVKAVRTQSTEELHRPFTFLRTLTSGGHGKIHLVEKDEGIFIFKEGKTTKDSEEIKEERKVLLALKDSPFVVDVDLASEDLLLSFVKGPETGLLYDYLEDFANKGHVSCEGFFNAVFFLEKQKLLGLSDIQEAGYVHGDLKPSNILYDPKLGRPLYIDFGAAAKEDSPIVAGHEDFSSPENTPSMLGKSVLADKSMDIWALGQMAHKNLTSMLSGEAKSFSGGVDSTGFASSERLGKISALSKSLSEFASGNESAIKNTSQLEMLEGSSINGLIQDIDDMEIARDALSEYADYINLMLAPDPNDRITPQEALTLSMFDSVDDASAKAVLQNVAQYIKDDYNALRDYDLGGKYKFDPETPPKK